MCCRLVQKPVRFLRLNLARAGFKVPCLISAPSQTKEYMYNFLATTRTILRRKVAHCQGTTRNAVQSKPRKAMLQTFWYVRAYKSPSKKKRAYVHTHHHLPRDESHEDGGPFDHDDPHYYGRRRHYQPSHDYLCHAGLSVYWQSIGSTRFSRHSSLHFLRRLEPKTTTASEWRNVGS